MIPILDSRQMRAADEAAIEDGVPSLTLMENAARGIADAIENRFPDWRRSVVVCGPGNNGGDGLAAARMLCKRFSVRVFTLREPDSYRADPAVNLRRAREAGIAPESLASEAGIDSFGRALEEADGVVDALFGTGLDRPLEGAAARVVGTINRGNRAVVAADVPSGLSSDSGEIAGEAVTATLTVAFAAPKLCHALPPARHRCGTVLVHDIGIPESLLEPKDHALFLATADAVRGLLPPRAPGANKGNFGRIAIIAGSRGKTGAAVLAARGALRGGAGLVTVMCPASLETVIVSALPEVMTQGLPEKEGALSAEAGQELARRLADFDAAVVGPGLGKAEGTVAAVETLLAQARVPVVVDADGLNAFAGRAQALSGRASATVLTPHPGEAGRLLGISAREVQADRLGVARELARSTGACVLLKGEASLTATADGRVVVNSSGTPLLATAGSGDVLSGLIGALLGAGLEARDAAAASAWLHGAAGERLAETLGDAGLLSREVADAIPHVRRELRASGARAGTGDTGRE
ncbi:MAG TPA: NAD(P)H-hydrate dehydratase [Thermoanaerobaculia bacterium]|jgi:NAD(P)H-hydrate epimerase|nr:NAD(P)H-hydrate dehydratase [Thermoanaerobaculia bacterium]